MRGLSERSLLKREAVWSSLEISASPGLWGHRGGVENCGFYMLFWILPSQEASNRVGRDLPATRGRSLFPTTRCFPLRARSTWSLFAIEAAAAGPGVILIRRYTAARLGRGRPGAAACWPWLVSGSSTCSREIRNLRRPEPS